MAAGWTHPIPGWLSIRLLILTDLVPVSQEALGLLCWVEAHQACASPILLHMRGQLMLHGSASSDGRWMCTGTIAGMQPALLCLAGRRQMRRDLNDNVSLPCLGCAACP